LTETSSNSDSYESDTKLGKKVVSILNKPDESTKKTENQLFTEPGVRGGRSFRPRTSTRIQIVSDDSIPDNLVGIEKCGSELSNNKEGNTASGVQIVGSSDEAGARISLSTSPIMPYNSQPCPSGNGENPSYHYVSILRQDFINAQYARATEAVPSKFEFLYKQQDSGGHCDNILPGGSESFVQFVNNRKAEFHFISFHDTFSREKTLHGLLRQLSIELTQSLYKNHGKQFTIRIPKTIVFIRELLTLGGVSVAVHSLTLRLLRCTEKIPDLPAPISVEIPLA
jgi:hypothetical protein